MRDAPGNPTTVHGALFCNGWRARIRFREGYARRRANREIEHDLRFFLGEQTATAEPRMPLALNRNRRAAQRNFADLACFLDHIEAPGAGGIRPAFGAPMNGSAVTTPGDRAAHGHCIGIHDQAIVCESVYNVGRGDIGLRADDRLNFSRVAPRHALDSPFDMRLGSHTTPPLAPP